MYDLLEVKKKVFFGVYELVRGKKIIIFCSKFRRMNLLESFSPNELLESRQYFLKSEIKGLAICDHFYHFQ